MTGDPLDEETLDLEEKEYIEQVKKAFSGYGVPWKVLVALINYDSTVDVKNNMTRPVLGVEANLPDGRDVEEVMDLHTFAVKKFILKSRKEETVTTKLVLKLPTEGYEFSSGLKHFIAKHLWSSSGDRAAGPLTVDKTLIPYLDSVKDATYDGSIKYDVERLIALIIKHGTVILEIQSL
jgi:hypothetical protein